MVRVRSLVKFFAESNRTVVKNLSFDLYRDEITGLLGHNGAGSILPSFATVYLCLRKDDADESSLWNL